MSNQVIREKKKTQPFLCYFEQKVSLSLRIEIFRCHILSPYKKKSNEAQDTTGKFLTEK